MSAQSIEAPMPRVASGMATETGHIVLSRIVAEGGAARTAVATDVAPLFTHKLSPQDWRRTSEKEIGQLIALGLVAETKGHLNATSRGDAAAARFLGQKSLEGWSWAAIRDIALIAKGLGIEKEPLSRLKPLARVEGFRTLAVQKCFGLSVRKNQPPSKLRAQLAVVALERAFGNRIKAGFGKGSALSSKAARLLAGQLSHSPRAFQTDAKLIAALAAESVGTVDVSLEGLRLAVLRGLGAKALEAHLPVADPVPQAAPRAPVPVRRTDPAPQLAPAANDRGPAALEPPKANRPDLSEFSRAVKRAASARAEGWPGSRKAYISKVWDAIRSAEPRWELSEIEFKCMLAEAHRLGAVVLANADLKDKKSMQELESSAVPYKNTVWHFVRVEE
ncbi:MAG: hypothetical protein WC807_16270 [Hyphomicrobium sp.]